MVALFVSLALIGFSVAAVLPGGLGWTREVVLFLKGASPVFAAIVGVVALFVGIADIKDKSEARAEEKSKV